MKMGCSFTCPCASASISVSVFFFKNSRLVRMPTLASTMKASTGTSTQASTQQLRRIQRRIYSSPGMPLGRTMPSHLGFVREVADDALVRFESAQNIGPHQSAQRGEVVPVLLGAAFQKRRKLFGAAQQSRAKEIKDRPQTRKAVLDRRAAEGDAMPAAQFLDRAALARARVF